MEVTLLWFIEKCIEPEQLRNRPPSLTRQNSGAAYNISDGAGRSYFDSRANPLATWILAPESRHVKATSKILKKKKILRRLP